MRQSLRRLRPTSQQIKPALSPSSLPERHRYGGQRAPRSALESGQEGTSVPSNITRTTFRVTDFLSWQQNGQLTLSPAFQRRSVWTPSQKSFLIDTIARGLPMPIIFVRDSINLESRRGTKELVDGQQRIRTLLAFIDPSSLPDFDPSKDAFTVRSIHNTQLTDKTFGRLPASVQRDILSYEISTHVLPLEFEDRDVLQVFARMNSTGLKLNQQELRNAAYAGAFKSVAYDLAAEQLDRWRAWKLFTEEQIARMKEVELVSDLLMNMELGLTGKTQDKIDKHYSARDAEWDGAAFAADRFRQTMDTIASIIESMATPSAWSSEVNFFTLFVAIYDLEWGLGSHFERNKPRQLPKTIAERAGQASTALRKGDVPPNVLDAMQRASADLGRRRTRFDYLKNVIETGV